MKRIFLPITLLVMAFLTACNTTQKLYEAQEYDQVILKAGPKACAGRASLEEIDLLGSAYHQANQADHERILSLKATGQPDVLPEIYERYRSMEGRQEALSCLPRDIKKRIRFIDLGLKDELQGAQNKAEGYLVARINQLMASNNATDIQQAKKLIEQLIRVNPENPQIDQYQLMALIRQAAELRTEFVYENRRRALPAGFEETVMRFDEETLAKFPLGVSNTLTNATMYVEVIDFAVSPNKDETVTFKESKEGLTASVTDHVLSKTATVKARVSFLYKDTESATPNAWNAIVLPDFETSSTFRYAYSTVEGNRDACSEQTLENLKKQAIPFPTDDSMLLDAAKEMNGLIAKTLMK